MSKKFLSLLLVLCMLLPLVPTMALPVFAAGEKAVAVAYRYADAANANFTRDTTSKLADYTTAGGVDIDGYKAWLESEEAYAIKQNDPNWKVGGIDLATATLSPFARVAFFVGATGDANCNTSWALTEAGYQELLPVYLQSYNGSTWSTSTVDIWKPYNLLGEYGKAAQETLPSWCGVTCGSGSLSQGMQFTATVAGEYTLGLDLYNDLSNHTLTILKKSGDTVTTLLPATYKASVASAVAALDPVELAVGDTITFAITGNGNACYFKPVVNLLSDEVITYKYSSAAANFTRTIDSEATAAAAFVGEDGVLNETEMAAYRAWLLEDSTYALTQNDENWKAGAYLEGGVLSPFNHMAFSVSTNASGAHTNMQFAVAACDYEKMVDAYLATYNAEAKTWGSPTIWGDGLGFHIMGQFLSTNQPYHFCGMSATKSGYSSAMQFTVPEHGLYTLSTEYFKDSGQHTFAVMKNNVIIWPASGTPMATTKGAEATATVAASLEALGALELKKGDVLSFVIGRGTGDDPCYLKPVVTKVGSVNAVTYSYADVTAQNTWTRSGIKYDASLSADENIAKLTAPGVWAITQNNPMWKAGQYNMTDGSLELFARVAFYSDITWAVTEPTYQTMITNYVNSAGTTQSVWAGYALMGQLRYDGITSSAPDGDWQSIHVAMQFTVPQDGRYLPSIAALEETGRHYVALMVNNEKVWPADDSWYRIEQGTKSTAGINGAMAAIGALELQAGDVVSLVATRSEWGGSYLNPLHITPAMTWLGDGVVAVLLDSSNGGSISYHEAGDTVTLPDLPACLGWDADGDGEVDYLEGATYTVTDQDAVLTAIEPGKTVFKKDSTHPTWDGSNIIFHDNWSIGHIVKATGVYAPVAYHDSNFFKVNSNGPWSGTGLGLYHTRANRIVFSGSGADGAYTPTIRYTAPYTGTVSLSYDMLNAVREVNSSNPADIISQGYAIYVNGQKKWPADGDWYWYNSEKTYAVSEQGSVNVLNILKEANGGSFTITASVKEGDAIEFRTIQGNATTYHTEQQPTVTYTSITEDYWADGTVHTYDQTVAANAMGYVTTGENAGKMTMPAGWAVVARPTSAYGAPDNTLALNTLIINADPGTAYTEGATYGGDAWFVAADRTGKGIWTAYPMVGWYSGDRMSANWWDWGPRGGVLPSGTYAAGYQYTVAETGKVNVSLAEIYNQVPYDTAAKKIHTYVDEYAAVFVDGVMVWPTKGGDYTNVAEWFDVGAAHKKISSNCIARITDFGDISGLSDIYVEAGDKVEVLFRRASGNIAGYGVRATVSVTEHPFATDFVKVVVDSTTMQIVDTVYAGQDATALYSQLDTYLGWDMDNDGEPDLANGGTIKNITETTFITSLRADAVSRFDKNLPFVYENNTFTYDESNTDWSVGKADWNVDFTVDTETKLTLGSVVTKLDTQYPDTNVLYDGTPGIGMYDKMNGGGIYNYRKWVIRQPVSQKAVGAFYTAPYSGVVDLDYSDIKGHWELNAADAHFFVTVGDTAYYAYYDDSHNTDATFFYVKKDARANGKITLGTESGVTEYYTYTDTDEDGTPDTMVPTAVTADTQGEKKEVYQQVYAGVYLAIVHNGEVIWPSNGVPFLYKSDEPNSRFNQTQGDTTALAKARAYEAFPTNLRVEAGDTIAFVANTDHVLNNMVYMDPMVTYTQVYDKAEAHAIIDVSSNFSVNIYAGESDIRASESGVVVTGQVDKILAKDMADKITYQPYQIINGQRIDFAPKTITLADMLALYAKQPAGVTEAEAKTADALYHYGYAAANYFDGDELPSVTETLLASIQPDTSEEAKKVEASLEEGVDRLYKILGATLMLEDELKMVFLVQTADGSAFSTEGLQLVINNALGQEVGKVGADAFTLPAEGGNGSQMLVSFTVPVSQYQEKQYVTILKDGVKASETVGYGVLTYVARQYEGGEGEADNLLRAIANITSPASTFEAGLVKASDTATFKYCGTWEPSGDTMISHWNESYVEVDFYGTSVTPVFSQSSTFLYSIDGGSYTQATANGEYTITAATAGEHTLRIKTTNRTNNVYFAGVQVESQYAIHRADSKAHYIHFVGDSISDAGSSFSRRVGDVLGWDYATTALSGIALETGYGYWSNNNPNMYAEFGIKIGMEDAFFKYGIPLDSMTGETRERYLGYYTDPSLDVDYEAMAYKPDIVFIFLGTNDELGADDAERFTETYLEFVANIKAAYGDTVEIWAMQALTSSTNPNNPDSPRFDCIQAAADALEAEYGDTFNFIDQATVSSWGVEINYANNDPTHPTGNGYNTLTEKISALLDAYYNTEA